MPNLKDGVKGAFDVKDAAAGDVGVTFGGAETGVAQKRLDVADVGAAFQEVSGESVAQAVDRELFGDCGAMDGFVEDMLGGTDGQRAGGGLTGKEPGLNMVKGTIFGEKPGGFFRKNGTTIFAAFPLSDIYNIAG